MKKKAIWYIVIAVLLTAAVIVLPVVQASLTERKQPKPAGVEKSNNNIVPQKEDNKPAVQKDDSSGLKDETVTYLITLNENAMIDTMIDRNGQYQSVRELILSDEGKSCSDTVKKSQAVAKASITKLVPKSDFSGSITFSALFNGMTVKAPKSAKERLSKINGVADVYELSDEWYFFDIENGLSEDEENSESDDAESSDIEESNTEDNGADGEDLPQEDTEPVKYLNAERLLAAYRRQIDADGEAASMYGGENTLIAVLDSEFDVNDEVFSQAPEEAPLNQDVIKTLSDRMKFNTADNITDENCYVSQKIAYAYDYADNDADTYQPSLLHGTLTAAIAAGNNGKDNENRYRGVAADAQLALMKIADQRLSDGRIAVRTEAFLASLDDAVKLGADVVCLSFGSYELMDEKSLYQSAFDKLHQAGIAVVCAAGNGGYNGMENDINPKAADIFYGTENTLSALNGVTAVGSAESSLEIRHFITLNDRKLYYHDLTSAPLSSRIQYIEIKTETPDTEPNGEVSDVEVSDTEPENETEETEIELIQFNEYHYIEEYNEQTLLHESDVSGRLLIVDIIQTELLDELCSKAEQKGAAGIALLHEPKSVKTDISTLLPYDSPVVWIESYSGSDLSEIPTGIYFIDPDDELRELKQPSVSAFSSYGGMDDLHIGAKLLSVGENVYTATSDTSRAVLNGTSASAPSMAGAFALVNSYLKNRNEASGSLQQTAEGLLLSAASPVTAGKQNGETLYVSPRVQGFGLLQVEKALTANAVLQTASGLQGISLGDNETGEYEFYFTVRNLSDMPISYRLSYNLQTDRSDSGVNTLTPMSLTKQSEITFTSDNISDGILTVEGNSSAEVGVTLKVDEKALAGLKNSFINGSYLEGYVFLTPTEDGVVLSLPYMGFYGSMEDISPFDNTDYDMQAPVTGLSGTLSAVAYRNGAYASCSLIQNEDSILFSRDAVRTSEDNSNYGVSFILPNFYTLRNTYDLTVTIYDENGKSLYTENLGDYSAYREKGRQPFEKYADGNKGLREQFLKMTAGRYKYEISARTMLANGSLSAPFTNSYWITLDEDKPTVLKAETTRDKGKTYLELTADDKNGILDFELYATAYDSKNDRYNYIDSLNKMIEAGYLDDSSCIFLDKRQNEDGSVTFRYDITDLQRQLSTLSVSTETWSTDSSDKKIAFKAIDNAYNASSVSVADAIIYGKAVFRFTDTDGNPAEGVSVTIEKKTVVSDKNGEAVFEGLEPDFYYAALSCNPADYDLPDERYIVTVDMDHPLYEQELTIQAYRTYVPEEDTPTGEQESTPKTVSTEEKDEPVYALTFVSVLLTVCVIMFLFRKNKT